MRATSGSPHMSSIIGAVRRHCHTMALYSGSPVSRSHTSVVSRWLVIPMESICDASTLFASSSSVNTPSCDDRMSAGSCSTQPGCGYTCGNCRCIRATMLPCLSTSIARDDVVPWSRAITYFLASLRGSMSSTSCNCACFLAPILRYPRPMRTACTPGCGPSRRSPGRASSARSTGRCRSRRTRP